VTSMGAPHGLVPVIFKARVPVERCPLCTVFAPLLQEMKGCEDAHGPLKWLVSSTG